MPREEEDVLAYIAEVIGGTVNIPNRQTVKVKVLPQTLFQEMADSKEQLGFARPHGAFGTEATLTNKSTGEVQQCFFIGIDRGVLHGDRDLSRVQVLSYIAHESYEAGVVASPPDIIERAIYVRESLISTVPEWQDHFTQAHLQGIFAANRFILKERGVSTAVRINKVTFKTGNEEKDEYLYPDRLVNIVALKIESRRR